MFGIVHRLDKETSGLIIVAKNDHSTPSWVPLANERPTNAIRSDPPGIPKVSCGAIKEAIGRHRGANPDGSRKVASLPILTGR